MLYLCFSLIYFIIFLLGHLNLPKLRFLNRSLIYIFAGLSFIFGFYISLNNTGFASSSIFCSILLVMPILILDPVYIKIILITFISALFCIFTVIVKSSVPYIMLTDIVNCVSLAVLSVFVSNHTVKISLSDMLLRSQIEAQRDTDSLTGLPNRRMYEESLVRESEITGIIMIDIDYFKIYNDTYGHIEGDDCLRSLGFLLMRFGEEHNLSFYRYGGEEFIGIVSVFTRPKLTALANLLVKSISAASIGFNPETGADPLTVSIGYCKMKSTIYDAVRCADLALYKAKSAGRNQAVEFAQL